MRSFIFYTKHRISFLSILPLAFFTLFCVAPVFSLPEHPFNLQLSLGTSANLYGDENINSYRTQYFSSDTSRFVLNGEVGTGFFLDEYISLNFGGIVSFDWFKHAFYADDGSGRVITDSMFPLDYDIFFGVRIFPFLLGFSFGMDYITGGRTNFLKLSGAKSKENELWSNGFRFIFEYNILNNQIGWSPAVGAYWQNMSRIGGHDNTFAVYIKASLR